ncbi:MAG: capsular biosynthesis protein CpsI, partial [Desulfobacter sp.]
ALGKRAKIDYQPMQAGDVPATWADVDDLIAATGFKPGTSIKQGIQNFVDWYKEYYVSMS